MAAHTTTLEVLGEARKVQYKQRFHSKVSRDMKCMFCRMTFSSAELQKKHIISCHWAIFEDTVSISYTCCKFLYNNVIATVYASASLYGFFIYESMYLCGTCDIVHFSILYRKEQARERKYGSLQQKDKDKDIVKKNRCKDNHR